MNITNKLAPIGLATLWIAFSEFIRNQVLFSSYWTDHYSKLGVVFPAKPINGMVWGLWSLVFAICLYTLSTKFTAKQTLALGWTIGFVLMWLVIGNLGVLPYKLLIFAIPLSVLEVFVAVWIIKRLGHQPSERK